MVDGDKSLVLTDKTLIEVAKRNIKKFNVVPLYYNMRKADPHIITNESIYSGLCAAFTGGNIGMYSNSISKIWNDEIFINGSFEEQCNAIDNIKRLCCQNNFIIDYAKTLYSPEFSDNIKKEIQIYTKNKLPYFFIYAKDKELSQVEEINDSFVNKLNDVIPNTRISCKYTTADGIKKNLNKPISMLMMHSRNFQLQDEHFPVIEKYLEFSKLYYFKIDVLSVQNMSSEILKNSQIRRNMLYSKIIKEVKTSLLSLGFNKFEVTDILVKYLYDEKGSKYKDLLWICFGDIILHNLEEHKKIPEYAHKFVYTTRAIKCVDCDTVFEVEPHNYTTIRCPSCQSIRKRELARLRKQRQREQECL